MTDHKEIEKFLPAIKEKLAGLDREELLKRVVSLEFDRFLDDYRHGEDLISPVFEKDGGERRSGRKSGDYHGNYKRLFINLGKSDGFYPEQLIELINKNTRGPKIPIGKIDLLKTFSFFEVEESYADNLIASLSDATFMDRRVAVEIAQEKPGKSGKDGDHRSKKAKWSDRKSGKKHQGRPDKRSREQRRENKFGRKEKNKYSR